MADILFANLADDSTVAFNPVTDRIIIDQRAYDVEIESASGDSFRLYVLGKRINFTASVKDLVGSVNLITESGVWVVGDNELAGSDPNPQTTDDGPNIILGSTGRDYLSGFGGNDTIYGGDESDALIGGAGNDFLDGGDGDDFAQFSGGALYANLPLHVINVSNGESDQVFNVEQIWSPASYNNSRNAFADVMIGDGADNYFSSYTRSLKA